MLAFLLLCVLAVNTASTIAFLIFKRQTSRDVEELWLAIDSENYLASSNFSSKGCPPRHAEVVQMSDDEEEEI